jgi:hypothetical protein
MVLVYCVTGIAYICAILLQPAPAQLVWIVYLSSAGIINPVLLFWPNLKICHCRGTLHNRFCKVPWRWLPKRKKFMLCKVPTSKYKGITLGQSFYGCGDMIWYDNNNNFFQCCFVMTAVVSVSPHIGNVNSGCQTDGFFTQFNVFELRPLC